MLFVKINLCLNVLSASMMIIAAIVFESSIESTAMKYVSDSLSISSMTKSVIEILSIEMSMSMINSSKNWAVKSSFWLSSISVMNCFKRRWNSECVFHFELRFAKRFFESSRSFFEWLIDQQFDLSHTKQILEKRIENLPRERESVKNLRLSR
jgi:hypothetical protein